MKFLRLTLILLATLARALAAEQAEREKSSATTAAGATSAPPQAVPAKPAAGKASAPASAESRSAVPTPQAAPITTKSAPATTSVPTPKKPTPKPAPSVVAEAPAPSRKNDAARDSVNIAELREKAVHGNTIAQYNLGLAYSQGLGVPVNLPEAYVWFSLASEKSTTGKAFERLVGGMSTVQVAEGNKHLVVVRDPANASAVASSRMIATANPTPEPVHLPLPEPTTTVTLKSDQDPAPVAGTAPRPVVKKPSTAEEIVPLFRPNRTTAETTAAGTNAANHSAANTAEPAPAKSAAAVATGALTGITAAPAGGAAPSAIAIGGGIPPEAAQRQIEKMAAMINSKGLIPPDRAGADQPSAPPSAAPRNQIDLDPDAQPVASAEDLKADKGSAHLLSEIEKTQADADAPRNVNDTRVAANSAPATAADAAPSAPVAGPRRPPASPNAAAGRTITVPARAPAAAMDALASAPGSTKPGASPRATPAGSSPNTSGPYPTESSATSRSNTSATAPNATASSSTRSSAPTANRTASSTSPELAPAESVSSNKSNVRADPASIRLAVATEKTRAASLAATAQAQAAAVAEEQRRHTVARIASEREARSKGLLGTDPTPRPAFSPGVTSANTTVASFDPTIAQQGANTADRDSLSSRLDQTQTALSAEISARTEALQIAQARATELAQARTKIDELSRRSETTAAPRTEAAPARFNSELAELRAQLERTTAALASRLDQTEANLTAKLVSTAATSAEARAKSDAQNSASELAELRAQLAAATHQATAASAAATANAAALADALIKVDTLANEKIRFAEQTAKFSVAATEPVAKLAAEKELLASRITSTATSGSPAKTHAQAAAEKSLEEKRALATQRQAAESAQSEASAKAEAQKKKSLISLPPTSSN